MSWVIFYKPIFLNQSIGLSAVQIGLLSTVTTISSVISPLAGGYLADRFGRKRVLMLFDSFGWLSSIIVWIVTQNLWFALIAYILESLTIVINSVWECMLVEDTTPKYRAGIFGVLAAIYSIGALSMPVAGYIIGLYGIDSGTRTLFIIALAFMIPYVIIRQAFLQETELGKQIMKDKSFAGLEGYKSSLTMIKRSRVIFALVLIAFFDIFYKASLTYLPLFLTRSNGLGLGDDIASFVPAALSASGLIIALIIVPRLSTRSGYTKTLSLGFGLGCISFLLLSYAPQGNLLVALVIGTIMGFHKGTWFSVSRTFLTNEIEVVNTKARAKILSINLTLSSLFGLPVPVLMGYLFSFDPKLPFIIVSITLFASLIALLFATRKETHDIDGKEKLALK